MKVRIFIWQDPAEEVAEAASVAVEDHAEEDSAADHVPVASVDRDPATEDITITDHISITVPSLASRDPSSVTDTAAVALAE